MRIVNAFILIFFVALISGCRTVYLEKETPAGHVPPVPAGTLKTEPPVLNPATNTDPGSQSKSIAEPDRSEEVVKQFQKAYLAKRSPRIAIFLNRELSSGVQEWATSSRLVVSGKMKYAGAGVSSESAGINIVERGQEGATKVAAAGTKIEGESGVLYEQAHNPLEERNLLPEDWMWQFEESFLKKFLQAKAMVVDPAMIMRKHAQEASPQDDPHKIVSSRNIEMEALKKNADILMEVLVRRNPDSPIGYEFRATAKEIPDGRILVNVSSLQWKQEKLKGVIKKKYKGTEAGYVEVKDDTNLPNVDRVVELLAQDVMKALTEIWSAKSS